jgi:acetylornithine deacetylase
VTLTAAEALALGSLDEEALVHDLVDLVRVPSITGTAAESEVQHDRAARLAELDFAVDEWQFDLAALEAHPLYPGREADRHEGYGVVATLGGGGVPALVLQGHVDVVPIGDPNRWQDHDPFSGRITGGMLHGRGACDMKAGVAANLAVAKALHTSGLTLERPFAVHSVVSEEDGGLGAFATLLRGHGGEAAVITEPTSGRIVTANAGSLTFTVTVAGRAAHGSTRLEGQSALDAFLPLYAALHDLERIRNTGPDRLFDGNPLPYPISIGRIVAGDWASSVPDLLTADGRLGVQLDEEPAHARAEFESAVARCCAADPWLRDHPAIVTWTGGQFASGRIESGHAFIDAVSTAVSDSLGVGAPPPTAAPYGSDLRLYTQIGGIPTLHLGPGDVRFAHAPREQVRINEVIESARALLLLAVRRCDAHS